MEARPTGEGINPGVKAGGLWLMITEWNAEIRSRSRQIEKVGRGVSENTSRPNSIWTRPLAATDARGVNIIYNYRLAPPSTRTRPSAI